MVLRDAKFFDMGGVFRFTAGMKSLPFRWLSLGYGLLLTAQLWAADVIPLWPGRAPGVTNDVSTEHDTSKPDKNFVAGKPVIRLGEVTQPSITVFPVPPNNNTGAAVVVCPGGGYSILAWDLEGTETCDWLNSIGVTAVLLKYRVPKHSDGPLQDVQRTFGLVRERAKDWGIDPKRIGILGFSAGGNLSAELCAHATQRAYAPVDKADDRDCRPDFQMLVYPGGLVPTNDPAKLVPGVEVTTNTPPAFIVMAANDSAQNALAYALALKVAKVPLELHIFPAGGHGFGLRRTQDPITAWPDLAAAWLKNQGWLESK